MKKKLWVKDSEGKLRWAGGSYWNLLKPRDWRDVLVVIVIVFSYIMLITLSGECWEVYQNPCHYCVSTALPPSDPGFFGFVGVNDDSITRIGT